MSVCDYGFHFLTGERPCSIKTTGGHTSCGLVVDCVPLRTAEPEIAAHREYHAG